jgi:SPP1 gp7 family putative phage head morphogenesis protein
VLRRIDNNKSLRKLSKGSESRFLFDQETEAVKWKAKLPPQIRRIIEQRGIEVLAYLGIDSALDLTVSAAVAYMRYASGNLIKEISATTLDELRSTLAEGIAADEGIPQLKARVTTVFERATTYRAQMIARTEVLRATNFATELAYKQSRIVIAKEWLTEMDNRTCPICGPMNGQRVKLAGEFAGNNEQGERTVTDYPPIHPQCRCTIIPVLSEKAYTKQKIEKSKHAKAAEVVVEGLKEIVTEGQKLEQAKQGLKAGAAELAVSAAKAENTKKNAEETAKTIVASAEEGAKQVIAQAREEGEKERQGIIAEVKGLRDRIVAKLHGTEDTKPTE